MRVKEKSKNVFCLSRGNNIGTLSRELMTVRMSSKNETVSEIIS